MTGQPYNFDEDGINQLLVVKVGADYFVARWGEAAKEEKWTFKPSNGDHWQPMAISTIVSYLKMHSVLKEIGTINIQEAMEGRMGQETHGVRQDIMLYAIQSIQQRTRKALGTWCHVHWLRRAPFAHAYQQDQELTLMSESPILQLNSIEGLFQAIVMDAETIPELSTDEAGEFLTMIATFLNLSDVNPGQPELQGRQMRKAGELMRAAVEDRGLQREIKEKFEAKLEAQRKYESGYSSRESPKTEEEDQEEC